MRMVRRMVFWAALATVVALVAGELFARYGYGLGDPPLSVADPEIDYLFAPNQYCRRFGNRIRYNAHSMRMSAELDARPRIFVVGDSVVNGGALTDQRDLATEILQTRHPDWQVCNVSAGSWGPGNYAAYFRRHPDLVRRGDVLVLVMSTHDLWEDDPRQGAGRIVGNDPSFPSRKPPCALLDGFIRYFLPRIHKTGQTCIANSSRKIDVVPVSGRIESERYNLTALKELFALPFSRRFVLWFPSRAETQSRVSGSASTSQGLSPSSGYVIPKELVPVVDLLKRHSVVQVPFFLTSSDYRDSIHPNSAGQSRLATALEFTLQGTTL